MPEQQALKLFLSCRGCRKGDLFLRMIVKPQRAAAVAEARLIGQTETMRSVRDIDFATPMMLDGGDVGGLADEHSVARFVLYCRHGEARGAHGTGGRWRLRPGDDPYKAPPVEVTRSSRPADRLGAVVVAVQDEYGSY